MVKCRHKQPHVRCSGKPVYKCAWKGLGVFCEIIPNIPGQDPIENNVTRAAKRYEKKRNLWKGNMKYNPVFA
jgi:hypothetical protein